MPPPPPERCYTETEAQFLWDKAEEEGLWFITEPIGECIIVCEYNRSKKKIIPLPHNQYPQSMTNPLRGKMPLAIRPAQIIFCNIFGFIPEKTKAEKYQASHQCHHAGCIQWKHILKDTIPQNADRKKCKTWILTKMRRFNLLSKEEKEKIKETNKIESEICACDSQNSCFMSHE